VDALIIRRNGLFVVVPAQLSFFQRCSRRWRFLPKTLLQIVLPVFVQCFDFPRTVKLISEERDHRFNLFFGCLFHPRIYLMSINGVKSALLQDKGRIIGRPSHSQIRQRLWLLMLGEHAGAGHSQVSYRLFRGLFAEEVHWIFFTREFGVVVDGAVEKFPLGGAPFVVILRILYGEVIDPA